MWDGCAGDVMGARRVRVGGRVGVEGKRMGDMKGLGGGGLAGWGVLKRAGKGGGGNIRPIESGHLGERVDDFVCAWPGEVCGVGDRSALDVVGCVVEDEVAVRLKSLASGASFCLKSRSPYLRETISVKHKRMQQLPRSHRHQQPTPPPPRLPLEPPILLQRSIRKLQRSRRHIDRDRDPQLIPRIHAEREARETRADRRSEAGRQGLGDAGIPPAEGGGFFGEQVRAEAGEEAEEEAVEEEEEGEGEGEPEVGGFEDGGLRFDSATV